MWVKYEDYLKFLANAVARAKITEHQRDMILHRNARTLLTLEA